MLVKGGITVLRETTRRSENRGLCKNIFYKNFNLIINQGVSEFWNKVEKTATSGGRTFGELAVAFTVPRRECAITFAGFRPRGAHQAAKDS